MTFKHKFSSVAAKFSDKTTVVVSDRVNVRPASGRPGPFSPRLNFEATVSALQMSLLSTKTTYQDNNNTITCQIHPPRALYWFFSGFTSAPGPVTVAYSRRLSITSVAPALAIILSSARLFDHTPEASFRQPSLAPHLLGSTISLANLWSGINAEWGVVLAEIGLRVKTGMQLGMTGLSWSFGGEWRKAGNSIGSSVACNLGGVTFKLDVSYLGQASLSPSTRAGLWTTAAPSAALVLTYIFVLRPRHRRERLRFFRDARPSSDTDVVASGLVILEAFYGPLERDEVAEGLDLDVTVALQALVHRSHPGVAKVLRIRYTFRGSLHYAEISDWMPVVLPLEEHLVD
ncbi:uncharacterized protein B0H18DRAFT_1005428 [Fomitopsis serialis]|uniref:uncharacterized protein n=1 Tax=Fomitopsis serialis TaxID=139415 RepID=UPI002008607E|nr:uncharacterized protein B0H18DRAFT_1005428 [Neoantrodia serialis]KAH9926752.1 hypothetical protein B0H18DRAFT_1005428 [Neoantrodia serialis]